MAMRPIGERGFSLVELLVAMAMLGILTAAVMQLILVSQQTTSRAASLELAQQEARIALDRIGTDLRWLGSYYTGVPGAGAAAITAASQTTLTFRGDVDGNTLDAVGGEDTLAAQATAGSTLVTVSQANDTNGNPAFAVGGWLYIANGPTREVAQITATNGTLLTLATALQNTYAAANSIVRSVETVTYNFAVPNLTRSVNGGAATTLMSNVSALSFTYYDGGNPAALIGGGAPANIRQIEVSITVTEPDGNARTLTTRVRPGQPGA